MRIGNWYGWRAGANKTAWPIFWRQIVTTMRNVAGQNFKFVLNGDVGYVGKQRVFKLKLDKKPMWKTYILEMPM